MEAKWSFSLVREANASLLKVRVNLSSRELGTKNMGKFTFVGNRYPMDSLVWQEVQIHHLDVAGDGDFGAPAIFETNHFEFNVFHTIYAQEKLH